MAPSQISKLNHLSPLNTNWHNRSMSDISAVSDTATFHSAHAHLELRPLSQLSQATRPSSFPKPILSPKLESSKMDRQDSGYSETPLNITNVKSQTSSRRTSIASSSTTTRPSSSNQARSKRRPTNTSSRPSTKRSSRSSAQLRTSNPGSRPTMSQRHTISTPFVSSHPEQQPQYQFFHFPALSSDPPSPPRPSLSQNQDQAQPISPRTPAPPPATTQYWTSDSTRRLEYAAIDAASKGIRGFLTKLVPDCILPAGSKRQRFHCDDGEADRSDCGSVRRYRLVLQGEEKDCGGNAEPVVRGEGRAKGRTGLLRRWTGRL